MPKLSATDSGSLDIIKRIDLTPQDIQKMSDEELHQHLTLLRRNRESSAPRASRKQPTSTERSVKASTNDVIVIDDDNGGEGENI